MAGMKSEDGLIFVVGGGQYVNIMGEDRGGDENMNLVFTNADALKLGQLLIEESGLDSTRVPVPQVAPLGIDVTPEMVREVWDAFVKPSQSDDAPPQSAEMRALMAILRATYEGLGGK
jgi:hypothetical protein